MNHGGGLNQKNCYIMKHTQLRLGRRPIYWLVGVSVMLMTVQLYHLSRSDRHRVMSSITLIKDVEKRFVEAGRRIMSIPEESLKIFNYPGLEIHRRNWNYPIIVPNCHPEVTNIVFLIPSAPQNFDQRRFLRTIWSDPVELAKIQSRAIFVVGLTEDLLLQNNITSKSTKYKDILQLDIYDSYYNLTLKTLGMFRWAADHCMSAKYVAKVDDDTMLNVPKILNNLNHLHQNHAMFLAGFIIRNIYPMQSGKWYDPIYIPVYNQSSTYPPYLAGSGYFLTNNFISELVNKCSELPFLHLEDVFITGICAAQMKEVHQLAMKGMRFKHVDGCQFALHGAIFCPSYSMDQLKTAWNKWHSGNCSTYT